MLTNHDDIKAWLDGMNIENYKSGSVTVDGDVDIRDKQLTEIPVQYQWSINLGIIPKGFPPLVVKESDY